MRLFVALQLDERTRAALARVRIPESVRGVRVRRVDARNLHLTLSFLGDVDQSAIPGVYRALSAASLGVPGFELRVRGLGAFPARGSPRTLWAGVDPVPPLLALERRLGEALAEVEFRREIRPYHPHVTLARVSGRLRSPPWDAAEASQEFGRVRVESIWLVESELHRDGPAYRIVERFGLDTT